MPTADQFRDELGAQINRAQRQGHPHVEINAAAIDWLCKAFGFQKHLVVPGENGTIGHAQLVFGSGMIMLGSARDDAYGQLQKPLDTPNTPVSKSTYVIVNDIDAHHARAADAGARVVMPPEDQDYSGRLYACRDPEGNLWNFGSYDPWK